MYQPYMDLIWILRIYSSYQSHGVSSMHIYFWIHSPTIRSEVPWRVSESLGLAAWQFEAFLGGRISWWLTWRITSPTPPKTNMEPKNVRFEDDFPFERGDFQVPC